MDTRSPTEHGGQQSAGPMVTSSELSALISQNVEISKLVRSQNEQINALVNQQTALVNKQTALEEKINRQERSIIDRGDSLISAFRVGPIVGPTRWSNFSKNDLEKDELLTKMSNYLLPEYQTPRENWYWEKEWDDGQKYDRPDGHWDAARPEKISHSDTAILEKSQEIVIDNW